MSLHNRLCKRFLKNLTDCRVAMSLGPVTLEHVAREAGVSPSTASRALGGKAREFRISVKTEQAILQAASKLGFQGSHVARSLRTQRSGLIGLLVPDASNPFFAAIARKATILAERHGLSTLLADSHDSIQQEKDLLAHLQSRQVEGFIVCPIGTSSAHLRRLEEAGAHVVVVDRWFSDVRLTTVSSENERGAFIATSEIIKQGHRKIGCLQGQCATSTNNERLAGYQKALEDSGIKVDLTYVRGDDFSQESGYRSTCELLDEHRDMSAVFAFGNQNALGALRAFKERNLKVPEDISLVTFDDAPFAEFLASPLSVVRQDVEAIGSKAAALLVEQIRTGQKTEKLLHRVPVEFVARQSIGPPKTQ
jgi:LacI family transcriptional regulator